jgi:hypothetical protein
MSFSQITRVFVYCAAMCVFTASPDQPNKTIEQTQTCKLLRQKGGSSKQRLTDSDGPVSLIVGGAESYSSSVFAFQELCSNLRALVVVLFTKGTRAKGTNVVDFVVHMINHANHEIYVMAYGFTDERIITALQYAAKRGVVVRTLLDKSYENNAKVLVYRRDPEIEKGLLIDAKPAIAHNKVIIIVNKDTDAFATAILTGSFNWTWSAQNNNAENLVCFINCASMTQAYVDNWLYRAQIPGTRKPQPLSTSAL